MTYHPQPVDTSAVRLPQELLSLAELLAGNTHDVWAQDRIREGWRYGPRRDDEKKTHPCLVPYEDLPESEKEYDRRMGRELLAVLYAMGYRVVKG